MLVLALAMSLTLTAAPDFAWEPPKGLSLLESERAELSTQLDQARSQRGSTAASFIVLGCGLGTMLGGFLALELVANAQDPVMPGDDVQIAPSTYVLGVIIAGGVAAIVGAAMALWLRFRDADTNAQIGVLEYRLERVDAAIASESAPQAAPDGSSFVPRADPSSL